MAAEIVVFGTCAGPSVDLAYAPPFSPAWDPFLVAVDAATR